MWADEKLQAQRWPAERVRDWHKDIPWICGFNFLPSTAVNFLEMWHPDNFDKATIKRELGWASAIGYNALRVNLPYAVWLHDREGLLERVEWFHDLSYQLGLWVIPVLFDDCEFSGCDPVYGPQAAPVPNVHNSRAVGSPGRRIVMDRGSWHGLEDYLRDVMSCFKNDSRILFWDLYNEPGNRMIFGENSCLEYSETLLEHSRDLMAHAFHWARDVNTTQPLTVSAWSVPPGNQTEPVAFDNAIDQLAMSLSDVVSFHAYTTVERMAELIDALAVSDRPLFCTEWMARTVGSRIADQLELFRERNVGAFNWGLVQGRTQTHLPWPQLKTQDGIASQDIEWFQNVLKASGEPYQVEEIELLRQLLRSA